MEDEKQSELARIFVGGLGEAVTDGELRRVFELAGGAVESLDIIRSKSRSFAYVDFSPSSDKSISKLFAKYNGCMWKGGKLRIEKAKEHYLKRLAREWAEDAATNANDNALQIAEVSSEIPQNLLPPEKRDIRIFFPRLRKVKVLPFNGTGKHKYSFQRVDISLPPKYFCDCEEHCGPTERGNQVCRVQEESGGMNQEEFNVMNKVMNTLFQKQNYDSVDGHNETLLAGHAENEADDDDLVINFVSEENDKITSLERQQVHQVSRNQLKSGTQEQRSKRGRSQEQKGNNTEPQNKKKKPLSRKQNSGDEFGSAITASKGDLYTNFNESNKLVESKRVESESSKRQSNAHVSWSQKSSWKKIVGDKDSYTFSIASIEEGEPRLDPPSGPVVDNRKENLEGDIIALTEKPELISDASDVPDSDSKDENLVKVVEFECPKMKTEDPVEAQPAKPNLVSSQPAQGASWMQKFSWTQMVGDNSTFSISQPVPCTTSAQRVLDDVPSSVDGKLSKVEDPAIDGSSVSVTKEDVSRSTLKDAVLGNNESSTSMSGEKRDVALTRTPPVKVEVSETCTFMRTAASLKEWAKTKAALSGSLKRKGNAK